MSSSEAGGAGIVVYNRKHGRGRGEVTKFLVYNARKRHKDGDTAANYFARTECVAGVQDVRFQELVPADARVEIDAKKAAGYWTPEPVASDVDLAAIKGRDWQG